MKICGFIGGYLRDYFLTGSSDFLKSLLVAVRQILLHLKRARLAVSILHAKLS